MGSWRRHPWRGVVIATLLLAGSGACGQPGPGVPDSCQAPEGVNNNPATIAETVDLINALREAEGGVVTLPCFLQSLQRPLRMNGTTSRLSAQPATGAQNPRLFLLSQDMWLSVVPDGLGLPFLELGQPTETNRSIKAEIEFPVHEPLTQASPYERLASGNKVTTCGICHLDEKPALGIPNAMDSKTFRPAPKTVVPFDKIREEAAACDNVATPERCEMFNALFKHGKVEAAPFPTDMPTIFQ